MALAQLIQQARDLPVEDRLTLLGELWDSLDPDGVPVSDAEIQLVQERARRLEAHSEDEMDWDAFDMSVSVNKS